MTAYQNTIVDAVTTVLAGVTDATSIERGFTRRPGLKELPLLTLYVTSSRVKGSGWDGNSIYREASLYVEYAAAGEDAEQSVVEALSQIEGAILDDPTLGGAVRCCDFYEDELAMVDQNKRVCAGVIEYRVEIETHSSDTPKALHMTQDIPEEVDFESLQVVGMGELREAREDERRTEEGRLNLTSYMDREAQK